MEKCHRDDITQQIQIVICRYNENLYWINQLLTYTENILVYNKGEPYDSSFPYKTIQLPNVGREGHTIYHHICENYDNLAKYTIFIQGNPFEHSPHLIYQLENLKKRISQTQAHEKAYASANASASAIYLHFQYLSEMFYHTKVFDCEHHSGLPMRITYNKVFNCNMKENKTIYFGAGGQFVVSRERIRCRPRRFYQNIVEILEYHVKPVEGWVIERLHNEIFTNGYLPIIIVCYNNHKYVENTILQLAKVNAKYLSSIIIMNNSSDDPNTVQYLNILETERHFFVKTVPNTGPWITPENNAEFYAELPDKFILTDPDLEFNPDLPANFVEVLEKLSDKYETSKVGFAIGIEDTDKMYPVEYITTICKWESRFWKYRFPDPNFPLFQADIDTTFSLINKKYWLNYSLRIAGNFTCRHLPFYLNNGVMTLEDEYEYYTKSKYSSFSKVFLAYYASLTDQSTNQSIDYDSSLNSL